MLKEPYGILKLKNKRIETKNFIHGLNNKMEGTEEKNPLTQRWNNKNNPT